MAKLSDLLAQKAALEKQIADAQREQRAAAIAQIKALMAEHGLTAADLSGRAAKAKNRAAAAARWRRNTATRPPATPGAAAVCSRAGSRPPWRTGKKLDDFAV